jgi:hypothetical protein
VRAMGDLETLKGVRGLHKGVSNGGSRDVCCGALRQVRSGRGIE